VLGVVHAAPEWQDLTVGVVALWCCRRSSDSGVMHPAYVESRRSGKTFLGVVRFERTVRTVRLEGGLRAIDPTRQTKQPSGANPGGVRSMYRRCSRSWAVTTNGDRTRACAADEALHHAEHPDEAYEAGTPLTRRLMNGAFFARIEISPEDPIPKPVLAPVYGALKAWHPDLGQPASPSSSVAQFRPSSRLVHHRKKKPAPVEQQVRPARRSRTTRFPWQTAP
jgi:hypothetical protein